VNEEDEITGSLGKHWSVKGKVEVFVSNSDLCDSDALLLESDQC
jgi:hypothetical protein